MLFQDRRTRLMKGQNPSSNGRSILVNIRIPLLQDPFFHNFPFSFPLSSFIPLFLPVSSKKSEGFLIWKDHSKAPAGATADKPCIKGKWHTHRLSTLPTGVRLKAKLRYTHFSLPSFLFFSFLSIFFIVIYYLGVSGRFARRSAEET